MTNTFRVPTYHDWLQLTPSELFEDYGADPAHRVRYTGHAQPLRLIWVHSIGIWAGGDWDSEPKMFNFDEPAAGVIKVKQKAYYNFKFRNRLFTPEQFATQHHGHEWLRAELSYRAILAEYQRAGQPYAVGSAAADAIARMHTKVFDHENLGMLPVELVLWARVFDALLGTYGLTYGAWKTLSLADKAGIWDDGPDDERSAAHLLHLPAVLALDGSMDRHDPQRFARRAS